MNERSTVTGKVMSRWHWQLENSHTSITDILFVFLLHDAMLARYVLRLCVHLSRSHKLGVVSKWLNVGSHEHRSMLHGSMDSCFLVLKYVCEKRMRSSISRC